jgi:transketolase
VETAAHFQVDIMPILDSRTGRPVKEYTIDQLIERARHMRAINEIALCAAGSGHSGGTLSVMDIAAALYLRVARHAPANPCWEDRDRIIWSAGHKAPALYVALAASGYFDERELMKLRAIDSPLQGHPHWRDLPGVEATTGSLGQGISIAVGMALAAKLDHKNHRVFAITTDGEQQEGSVWEAVMSAAHHHLDNLVVIIDKNRLQIDGPVSEVMNIDPLDAKYRAFGWHVLEVDGHNMSDLVDTLDWARNRNDSGKSVVVICHTVKGKGVSFMENAVGWHGKPPNREELARVLAELGKLDDLPVEDLLAYGAAHRRAAETAVDASVPRFGRSYWWNSGQSMNVDMLPTRKGFGAALEKWGDDPRIVCLGADISDSIAISDFYKSHPDRRSRFISVGIAEQNATTIAAGLAREGKIPVFGTYGVFASARNLDQIRVSICYANLNVLIAGAHGGISVGPDGATHQELEAIFQITGLPNMHMGIPCDVIETEKMTRAMLFDVVGPKYLRFAREATPVVTKEDTPFTFGKANIFRLRKTASRFVDAFEIIPAVDYKSEQEDVAIISCGPQLAEALRATYILKEEYKVETRVVNLHTIKPVDTDAIVRAAKETQVLITAEEHQVGGLGNRVAGVLMNHWSSVPKRPFAMIGVEDRFGESGPPWVLIKKFGLTAEHIAQKAQHLLHNKTQV